MLQLCVCRDIEHLGSLESTQEAAPRATLTPRSCSPNFPRAQYLDIRTLPHELIVKSCMRKIRHAIRKQLVRQICVSFAGIKLAKTPCEQLSSNFCFVFCFVPSGFKYFSCKMSTNRLF